MTDQNLREQVLQQVRAEIISGQSMPGSMYSVPTLAARQFEQRFAHRRCRHAEARSKGRHRMRRIAAAMDQEHSNDPEGSADVFILDDVTPRYATANAALNACRAGLGHALQYLSESGNPA